MKTTEERLALVKELQPRMTEAMERVDAEGILAVLLDPRIERVEFSIGATYRLAVYGGPKIGTGQTLDTAKRPGELIDAILGMDSVETVRSSGAIEITGTYRGRTDAAGSPHVFRLPSGESALLADLDILAWRHLSEDS